MESISDLPELVAEDYRFGRGSISDLPELVAEDFRFGRESISDLPELVAEVRISELPDYFRITELPGERILKCLQNRWILDIRSYRICGFTMQRLVK